MLGTEFILGHDCVSVDSKMRMVLPKKYGIKPGAKVCIKYNIEAELFTLYSEEDIINELKRLKELYDNAKTDEDKNSYGHNLAFFSVSVVKKTIVDSQGRIILSNHFNPSENLILVGCGEYVLMVPESRLSDIMSQGFIKETDTNTVDAGKKRVR